MTDAIETSEKSSAPATGSPRTLGAHWMLIVAVTAAAAAALYGRSPSPSQPPPAPAVEPPQRSAATATPPGDASTNAISGKVVERIDVEKYTYLRLDTGTWAAVSSANVNVGDSVRVVNAELMTGFVSATLKRTFEKIYFGSLESKAGASPSNAAALKAGAWGGDPHAGVPGAPPLPAHAGDDPHAGVPGAPPLPAHAAGANPHGAASATGESVAIGKVVKAEGHAGRTVAEIHSQRATLKGNTVRVRGVVVKSVSGVLGRTFVHVRDGSGSAESANHDLSATTVEKLGVGQRVLLEGKLSTDKDFGAGYSYPVLIEDARVIPE